MTHSLPAYPRSLLEKSVIRLKERTYKLYVSKKNEFGVTSSPRPGVDSENYLGMVALLGTLETGFSQVKVNRFPAPVGIDFDSDRSEMARNRKEFIELAAENIEHVTAWVSKQEAAIEAATRR